MQKTIFTEEDFRPFEDPKSIMMQIFGVTCSVCGIDEIAYVSENAPKTLGQIAFEAMEENPEIGDEELDDMLDGPMDAWQEVDDYNSSIGMPTFSCDNCYRQLLDGEISIDINKQEK